MDAINYSFKKSAGQITVFMIKKNPIEAEGEGRGTLNFEPNNFEFLFKLRFECRSTISIMETINLRIRFSDSKNISSHRAKQG